MRAQLKMNQQPSCSSAVSVASMPSLDFKEIYKKVRGFSVYIHTFGG